MVATKIIISALSASKSSAALVRLLAEINNSYAREGKADGRRGATRGECLIAGGGYYLSINAVNAVSR